MHCVLHAALTYATHFQGCQPNLDESVLSCDTNTLDCGKIISIWLYRGRVGLTQLAMRYSTPTWLSIASTRLRIAPK